MAVTNGWGQATQNNTNGFGKYQNTIDAGSIYADSYAGETSLVGTSAAFSYSASSFHQDEADPTPTITGTAGGTFSATPSGLSINTSTGTIDLDASTIQSYTITYTVSGVSSSQSLAVTASPFIDNNFSMNFDSASSQYIDLTQIDLGTVCTISFWLKKESGLLSATILGEPTNTFKNVYYVDWNANTLYFKDPSNNFVTWNTLSSVNNTDWHHYVVTRNGGNTVLYLDGVSQGAGTVGSALTGNTKFRYLGVNYPTNTQFFDGKIDELAAWDTALSSDAVTEIYNATANNTGKALDLSTDTGNYTSSSNLQYWNRLGD